jgi:hypothetical protein
VITPVIGGAISSGGVAFGATQPKTTKSAFGGGFKKAESREVPFALTGMRVCERVFVCVCVCLTVTTAIPQKYHRDITVTPL